MIFRTLGLMGMLAAVAGCHRTDDAPAASVSPAPVASVGDQPTGAVPPATAPAGTFPPHLRQAETALARMDGYGDLRLGMDASQARAAWGGDLRGDAAPDGGCYLLRPQWADDARRFGFMFEQDRLVRYQTNEPKELAPGGGRVGMTLPQLRSLYPDGLEAQPHKYVPGAQTLRHADTAARSALVFETDADGKVLSWRVGLPPQVDYVEGCG
ncbi:lectin [Xanthomonas sp. NCPPB 1067]|uniref:Lectin n=2 Tax=Xanthomonas TaxID=338 RepID=A0A2S7DJH5_9XANT|nr:MULTISPECIES: lectin [Xanthomonas]MCC4585827.1 lectin [Xanthomonas sp. NCPPB 1067]MCC4599191.1 lectin [Xanthomonas melonis]MCD0279890.1 lectin [Xanthomonas melonis]PPU73983.1 lectin [Xanthomonas melonis]